MNRTKLNTNNKTGYRGVVFIQRGDYIPPKPWMARAKVNYKENYLGLYATKEEAAEAAKEWRLKNMPGALS